MECMVCGKKVEGEQELCNDCYQAGQELLEEDEDFKELNKKINRRKNELVKKVIKNDDVLQKMIKKQTMKILKKRKE